MTARVIIESVLESRKYGSYSKNEAGKETLDYQIKLGLPVLHRAGGVPGKMSLSSFRDSLSWCIRKKATAKACGERGRWEGVGEWVREHPHRSREWWDGIVSLWSGNWERV